MKLWNKDSSGVWRLVSVALKVNGGLEQTADGQLYLGVQPGGDTSAVCANIGAISKDGSRGMLAGNEVAGTLSGSTATISITSPDTSVYNTSGATTLTFVPSSTPTDCAVKVIALKATASSFLTIVGASWANNGDAPAWGNAGTNLVLIAHFVNSRVVLCVFDNSQA